ncbi:lipase [Pedobacter sp. KBW06]|uniref:lipase family protein n=1 Tax=Pedobacter sp. KBW06 TaxID=2153359 RepID=UPI000F5A30B0|nr:lipase family protein [Pedobacter sp. KBW06]RQO74839.1 lipase [Pedobacter sp. KBW06]
MKFLKLTGISLFLLCYSFAARSQQLKPGFDKAEYRELIYLSATSFEFPEKAKLIPKPEHSKLAYQSKSIGLDNAWELWIKDHSTAILGIRGSTAKSESWLANLYAAMVPAKGTLNIDKAHTFEYELSSDPKAAVHAGFLISTAFIAEDMLPKIDSCYQSGIRDFIIMGHSQGGAISYLLTAHLYHLQKQGRLAKDIRFKTYCSAAPKPGNLYFAYSYEAATQNGWAYNVINAADWVPQTPFSVQMLDDLPEVSPVPLIEGLIKKQSFFKRIFLNMMYNKVRNPSRKVVKRYQKLLGEEMAKRIKTYLPDYKAPAYYNSSNYVRTGTSIVLYPDSGYALKFPNEGKDIMIHHSFPPYLYLLDQE